MTTIDIHQALSKKFTALLPGFLALMPSRRSVACEIADLEMFKHCFVALEVSHQVDYQKENFKAALNSFFRLDIMGKVSLQTIRSIDR